MLERTDRMKALVTGATGFLGSHLVDHLLQRGDDVRALVRASSDTSFLRERDVEMVAGDITGAASLGPAVGGVDVVYHTAANVADWGPWPEFQSATIDGTRNVLEAAAAAGIPRFLHVSTLDVYALSALRSRVTEGSPLEKRFGWLDYYRRSKVAAEKIARRYAAEGRLGVTIVRPGLLFGERDGGMFPGIAAFLKSGSSAYLGSGRNRLPYVYAGDVADACILAATTAGTAGEIYNVASDEAVTQRDLFQAVAEATGLAPPRRGVPLRLGYTAALFMEAWCVLRGRRARPEATRYGVNIVALDYHVDASKLKSLGWQAKVPMREAMRRCVEPSSEQRSQPAGA